MSTVDTFCRGKASFLAGKLSLGLLAALRCQKLLLRLRLGWRVYAQKTPCSSTVSSPKHLTAPGLEHLILKSLQQGSRIPYLSGSPSRCLVYCKISKLPGWNYGTGVPSGLFIPSLLTGAAFGRLVGQHPGETQNPILLISAPPLPPVGCLGSVGWSAKASGTGLVFCNSCVPLCRAAFQRANIIESYRSKVCLRLVAVLRDLDTNGNSPFSPQSCNCRYV